MLQKLAGLLYSLNSCQGFFLVLSPIGFVASAGIATLLNYALRKRYFLSLWCAYQLLKRHLSNWTSTPLLSASYPSKYIFWLQIWQLSFTSEELGGHIVYGDRTYLLRSGYDISCSKWQKTGKNLTKGLACLEGQKQEGGRCDLKMTKLIRLLNIWQKVEDM